MTLRRRLQKLEQTLPGRSPLADDPEYQYWRAFYEIVLELLAAFPEARQKVEKNMSIQDPCIFRPDWGRAASGADMRFYFCKESVWAALEKFPEARQLLHAFVDDFEQRLAKEQEAEGAQDRNRTRKRLTPANYWS
jgi:hypothetical protein